MPSPHSSSSHSSSSRSGSSHSSSRSSSRGSSGSFRSSPSRHSGSSHSSRSHGGGSGGGFFSALFSGGSQRSSGPSRHSGSSHYSSIGTRAAQSSSYREPVIQRERRNQPTGYQPSEHYDVQPIPYYGKRHNYLYYPLSWTDQATGQSFKRGYYDEDGAYYENVVFRRDGQYKDVVCRCEYCDTVTKIDWTDGGPLICPQCGGAMTMVSAVDEQIGDAFHPDPTQRASDSGNSRGGSFRQLFFTVFGLIAVIALVALGGFFLIRHTVNKVLEPDVGSLVSVPSNPEIFGSVIRLNEAGPGVYEIVDQRVSDPDRVLRWDSAEQSYHDPVSDLWAWYNNEVSPALWQYWYEPISADYGDYGWMEFGEDGQWYIEVRQGEWIALPERYDVSPLWHIEARADDAGGGEDGEDSGEALRLIPTHGDDSPEDIPNPRRFNEIIYLEQSGTGSYVITGNYDHDLEPVWQEAEQSYYEPETGLWLWYNTELDPNRWQYWYEPISGDYGNYGWLEFREDGQWYVKADPEAWIPLPERYDVSPLWHIEASPQDAP